MKKSMLVLISLVCFSFSKAQQYTENLPFDTTLYNGHYIANSFCTNPVQVRIEYNSSLFSYVNGMQFFIIIDSVNFPGPIGISPVQPGDTIVLDVVNHVFTTPSVTALEYWYRIKLAGTPTLVNQTYPCKLEVDQCTCFCTDMVIRASITDTSICTVGLSNFIGDLNDFRTISVYPNPAGKTLSVKGIDSKTRIFLYTTTGKLILEREVNHDNMIDIGNFSNGLYWLSIGSEKEITSRPLVIIAK